MFPGVTLKSVERRGYWYDAVFDVPDELDISMSIFEVYGAKVLGINNSEGGTTLLIDERLDGLITCGAQSYGILIGEGEDWWNHTAGGVKSILETATNVADEIIPLKTAVELPVYLGIFRENLRLRAEHQSQALEGYETMSMRREDPNITYRYVGIYAGQRRRARRNDPNDPNNH